MDQPLLLGHSPIAKMQRALDAIAAFERVCPLQTPAPPATEDEIARAEDALGFRLPPSMRLLYRTYNGLQTAIIFDPLFAVPEHPSLVASTSLMRSHGFPVTDGMFVFGGNGSEEWSALWKPDNSGLLEPIVVSFHEDSEPAWAIVGDDLGSYLLGHLAAAYALEAVDHWDVSDTLDVLGLPEDLRIRPVEYGIYLDPLTGEEWPTMTFDEGLYGRIIRWANPEMPGPLFMAGDGTFRTETEIDDYVASRNR